MNPSSKTPPSNGSGSRGALILPASTLTRPLPRGEEWELGHFCQWSKALIQTFSQQEKEIGHDPDIAFAPYLFWLKYQGR